MCAIFGVERIGETAFDGLKVSVEVDVGDVVFLEEFDIVVFQGEVGKLVAIRLGKIFRINGCF
jgi:hypothetical protein